MRYMLALLLALSLSTLARAQSPGVSALAGESLLYWGPAAARKLDVKALRAVVDKDLTAPPGSPSTGARYIVASPATGAWAGHEGNLARWTGSTYDYEVPATGAVVWVIDEAAVYSYSSGAWAVLARHGGGAGSGDMAGPASSTDNALTRYDGTTGKATQNGVATESDAGGLATTIANSGNSVALSLTQNDSTNNPRAMQIVNTSTAPALHIDQNANTSALLSGGAVILDNSDNTGAGLTLLSTGANAGHLLQLNSTNTGTSTSAAYITNYGTRPSLWIEHYGSGSANGNGLLVNSYNASDSALGVTGHETGRGTIKATHFYDSGDDHNAAVLSLYMQGAGTQAQGIYVDSDGSTGKLLNLRKSTVEQFTVDGDGNSVQLGENRANTMRVEPSGNTSSSLSVGGSLLLRNTSNTGGGLTIYSDAASSTGHLASIWADNAAYSTQPFYILNEGSSHGAEIDQHSTGATANGLLISSTNPNSSALWALGEELTQGTLKATHTYSAGDDHNAAGLAISLAGAGTQAQGIFVDSSVGTTGPLLNIRNLGAEHLRLESNGYLQVTSDSTTHALLLDANGNTSSSTSVGGALLLENTGNTGSGFVIYSNNATSTGNLLSVRADSSGFGGEVARVDNDGTNNALRVVQSSSGSASNGVLVSSTNANDSAVEVTGVELSQPSLKITHTATSGDSTASVLYLNAAGSGTAARGLLIDSTGATTGNLIDARNNGTTELAVGPSGDVTVAKSVTVNGTTGYIRFPRLTTTQRDALTPAEGMCAWITTTHTLDCYDGTSWGSL